MKNINIIIESLKEKQVKVTPQRVAVIEYLEKNPVHPTADDIFRAVSKKFPAISLATVYNTLEKLEEINEVYKLQFTKESSVNYEYNLEPHLHFYCSECSKIYDIWEGLPCLNINEIDGHQIVSKRCYFIGMCKNCIK
ncbi:Fur family transcriptional regulator [Candidatus Margulisiibacteriota bacterium]